MFSQRIWTYDLNFEQRIRSEPVPLQSPWKPGRVSIPLPPHPSTCSVLNTWGLCWAFLTFGLHGDLVFYPEEYKKDSLEFFFPFLVPSFVILEIRSYSTCVGCCQALGSGNSSGPFMCFVLGSFHSFIQTQEHHALPCFHTERGILVMVMAH